MGKIRIKALGDEEKEKKQKAKDEARREAKKESQKALKITESTEETVVEEKTPLRPTKSGSAGKTRERSKHYQKVRAFIDKTINYPIDVALDLIKKSNLTKFDATVETHINTLDKNIKGNVSLPHGIGRKVRVAVVDDKLLTEVEAGKINFDILISHPSFMPKLAKLAKILGPKGLMPNPKAGTISTSPEETAKKFAGLLQFKTESDFPIIHTVIGKASFDNAKLLENFQTLIKAIGATKIKNVFIKTSMSPSVKVQLETAVES